MTTDTYATTREQVLEALRSSSRFLLVTHEGPDGDALGSLVAMQGILDALGKDVQMFIAPAEFPLPYEYRFFAFDGLVTEIPADVSYRLVVFLDCGNIDRSPALLNGAPMHIVNIDHHHDNTRFGTVNLVVGHASCTAEIVLEIGRELGASLTQTMAEALYIGLVTDTGKFMFDNTTPEAHAMAAELIEAGVSPAGIHRRLYEGLPFARLQLLARALSRVERYDDGVVTMTTLYHRDFAELNALDTDSEGIVDHLRAVENTAVAVLIRELIAPDRVGQRKVSLRATDDRVDVSVIARSLGGGGHRQAAGLSTEHPLDELKMRVRAGVAAQLGT
jgi:phosphoesterase RecJ-like protein